MQIFDKHPEAVKDYGFDYTDWLDGDTIDTSTWTVSGADKISESHTTTKTTVWVGGGRAREAKLRNVIETAGGRTEVRTILLRIRET